MCSSREACDDPLPLLVGGVSPVVVENLPENQMKITELQVSPAPVDWRRFSLDCQMGWKTSDQVQEEANAQMAQMILDPRGIYPCRKPLTLAKRYLGLAKIPGLVEALKLDWADDKNKKVVLFFDSRDVAMGLREALTDYNPVLLFKGTPMAQKEKRCKQFATRWQNKVLLCQILGMPGPLPALDRYFVELTSNPLDNLQACCDVTPQHRLHLVTLTGTVDGALMRARWDATMKLLQGVTV
jgi:hypothetical protein